MCSYRRRAINHSDQPIRDNIQTFPLDCCVGRTLSALAETLTVINLISLIRNADRSQASLPEVKKFFFPRFEIGRIVMLAVSFVMTCSTQCDQVLRGSIEWIAILVVNVKPRHLINALIVVGTPIRGFLGGSPIAVPVARACHLFAFLASSVLPNASPIFVNVRLLVCLFHTTNYNK
jgi:hypothetical protein